MAEWFKAHAWKVCKGATLSRVRIPLSPPSQINSYNFFINFNALVSAFMPELIFLVTYAMPIPLIGSAKPSEPPHPLCPKFSLFFPNIQPPLRIKPELVHLIGSFKLSSTLLFDWVRISLNVDWVIIFFSFDFRS